MEDSKKQIFEIRNIISITVLNLIQMQNLKLSDYLSIDYPNLKTSGCFYYNIPERKQQKRTFR